MVQLNQGANNLFLNTSVPPPSPSADDYSMELISETTLQGKKFTLDTRAVAAGWNTRDLQGLVTINDGAEDLTLGIITLEEPNFPAGFYQLRIFQRNAITSLLEEIGRGQAYVNRKKTEVGFVQFKDPSLANTIKAYEQ